MNKSLKLFTTSLVVLSVLFVGIYAKKARARAPQQYSVLDAVAGKLVQKYQTSTCEQLWKRKARKLRRAPGNSG